MTDKGLKPDWKKVEAILRVLNPIYAEAVRRLQDMVICLAKFLMQLSTIMEPMRRVSDWEWGQEQETAKTENIRHNCTFDVSSQRVGRLIGKRS